MTNLYPVITAGTDGGLINPLSAKLTLPQKVTNQIVTVTYTKDSDITKQFLATDGGVLASFTDQPATPK